MSYQARSLGTGPQAECTPPAAKIPALSTIGSERMISPGTSLSARSGSRRGVLSKTDLLTVLSRRLGKHLMQTYGLSICELPFASPTIRTGMLSHRRFDNQLAHPGHYRRDSIYQ